MTGVVAHRVHAREDRVALQSRTRKLLGGLLRQSNDAAFRPAMVFENFACNHFTPFLIVDC